VKYQMIAIGDVKRWTAPKGASTDAGRVPAVADQLRIAARSGVRNRHD
jgi:hypothetical protein